MGHLNLLARDILRLQRDVICVGCLRNFRQENYETKVVDKRVTKLRSNEDLNVWEHDKYLLAQDVLRLYRETRNF